jgi:hypothetical protein
MTNLDDLKDSVHLTPEGATNFAKAIARSLEKLVASEETPNLKQGPTNPEKK